MAVSRCVAAGGDVSCASVSSVTSVTGSVAGRSTAATCSGAGAAVLPPSAITTKASTTTAAAAAVAKCESTLRRRNGMPQPREGSSRLSGRRSEAACAAASAIRSRSTRCSR